MREGQPSVTALQIAFVVIAMGQRGSELLPRGEILQYQIAILQAVAFDLPFYHRWPLWLLTGFLGVFFSHILYWTVTLLLGRNTMECVAFRKAFMEQQVRQFLHDNPSNSQVLVLGAGYDTLALRLANEYDVVTFWELDHPSTGNFRNRIWDETRSKKNKDPDYDPTASSPHLITNLHHATVDMARPNALLEILTQQINYNCAAPTIVILEGVTMYLTTQQMQDLIQNVENVTGMDSILCFDMLQVNPNTRLPDLGWTTPLIDLYLKLKGEPWNLGMDDIRLKEVLDNSQNWALASPIQRLGPASYAAIQRKS